MQFPTVLAAIAIFHSVPNQQRPLRLTTCLAGLIFQRQIVLHWDDAPIRALNPWLNVPPGQQITVYVRADSSGSTDVFSHWAATCADGTWGIGVGGGGPASGNGTRPSPRWDAATKMASSSESLAALLSVVPFAISYIDSGVGISEGLQEIELQNPAGTWITSKNADYASLAASLTSLPAASGDWSNVSLINRPEPNAYPITTFSYFIIHQNMADMGEQGALVKALLHFLLSDDGQALAETFGFAHMPNGLTGGGFPGDTGTGCITDKNPLALTSGGKPYLCTQLASITLGAGITDWALEDTGAALSAVGAANQDKVFSQYRLNSLDYALTQNGQLAAGRQFAFDALSSSVQGVDRALVLHAHGSGSTQLNGLFLKATDLLATRAKKSIRITYRAVGSGTGIADLFGTASSSPAFAPLSNFAGSDFALTGKAFQSAGTNGFAVYQVPVAISMLSVFHTLPAGAIAGPLKLSADVLAGIFQGKIATWDDAAILAINPGLSVPMGQKIYPVARSESSGETLTFTTWLSAAAAVGAWALGVGSGGAAPAAAGTADTGSTAGVPVWPASVAAMQGSSNIVAYMRSQPYAIGYVDRANAAFGGSALAEAALRNADGQYVTAAAADVSQSTSGMLATAVTNKNGKNPDGPLASWANVNLMNQPGAAAFPMVVMEYMMMREDMSSMREAGSLTMALAKFLISAEMQGGLGEFGLSPVPAEILARCADAFSLASFADGVVQWSFEMPASPAAGTGTSSPAGPSAAPPGSSPASPPAATSGTVTTDASYGMSDHTFSSFRDSYESYKTSLLTVQTSSALAKVAGSLTASTNSSSAGSSVLAPASSTAAGSGAGGTGGGAAACACTGGPVATGGLTDLSTRLAIAALVVALLAGGLGTAALVLLLRGGRSAGAGAGAGAGGPGAGERAPGPADDSKADPEAEPRGFSRPRQASFGTIFSAPGAAQIPASPASSGRAYALGTAEGYSSRAPLVGGRAGLGRMHSFTRMEGSY